MPQQLVQLGFEQSVVIGLSLDACVVCVDGEIIDDIDYYNRVHEMLHICTSNANRENDDIEGFGWRWDSRDAHASAIGDAAAGVASGSRACASFKPLSGLLCGNSKYIPLTFAPLTFEFEIVFISY